MKSYKNNKGIQIDRFKAISIIKEVSNNNLEIPLTLFKSKGDAWLLVDGWNGLSYLITNEEIKNKLWE